MDSDDRKQSGMCDILIFLESFGEDCEETNRRLALEGSRISENLGGRTAALSVGEPREDLSVLAEAGVSLLYILRNDLFSEYCHEVFSRAIAELIRDIQPKVFLLVHSDAGKELAPSVAYRSGTAAVTDCVDIRADASGRIWYTRPVYKGQFEQETFFGSTGTEIATIRRDTLDKELKAEKREMQVIVKEVYVPPEIVRTKRLELIPPDFKTTDIVYAKRIIGTGAGIADKELLPALEEFAELLHASLGATRPVVDDGYLPKDRMIGQTGKMVSPDLYVSLGVSGSPHHVAGIQESGEIISVNRDAGAPIFELSDVGFVGDLKRVLPKLVKRIKGWQLS